MNVFVIEKGSTLGTQKGEIHQIHADETAARNEMARLRAEAAKSSIDVVTDGVADWNKGPGVLDGFWFGPRNGNTGAHGYLLTRMPVIA